MTLSFGRFVRRSLLLLTLAAFVCSFAGASVSFAQEEPTPVDAKAEADEAKNDEKSPSDEKPKRDEENKPAEAAKSDEAKKPEAKTEEKKADEKKADAEKPKTHKVEASPFRATLKVEGTFEPEETTEYALRLKEWQPPKNTIEVLEAVPHGTRVVKGTVLAKLDAEDLEKAIEDAERSAVTATLDATLAEIELAALKKLTPMEATEAERAVSYAKDDLKYFLEIEKPLELEQAEFMLAYQRFNLKSAEEELKQLQQMYDADDLTEETEEIILERTKMQADMARVGLKEYEASHRRRMEVELPRRELARTEATEKTQISLDKAKTQIEAALKKAELAVEKAKLATTETAERLADLKADLETLTDLKARSSGYVYYGKLRDGAWSDADTMREALRTGGRLAPDQVFLTVVSPKVSRVRVEVEEKNLHLLEAGVRGEANAVAYPDDEFEVRVESVDTVPIAPGKFVGRLTLPAPSEGPYVPGMKCEVELVTLEKKSAIAVPKSAVFEDEATGDDVVYLHGKKPEKRAVKKGPESGDRVLIVSGLKEGDEILLEKPQEKSE
jgi:multidrug efflux pump subunit AcrA (membrane-fusion protein)